MDKEKMYIDWYPLRPIVSKDIPEALKNTLRHWHLYKEDIFVAYENGKFGRYLRNTGGKVIFDDEYYDEEEIEELTTFLAEEENMIENEGGNCYAHN